MIGTARCYSRFLQLNRSYRYQTIHRPLFNRSLHALCLKLVRLLLNACYTDYGYNYYGPFNYMAAYDYYGYDTNMYGYYGRYNGNNFYENTGRGRAAGKCFYITCCLISYIFLGYSDY